MCKLEVRFIIFYSNLLAYSSLLKPTLLESYIWNFFNYKFEIPIAIMTTDLSCLVLNAYSFIKYQVYTTPLSKIISHLKSRIPLYSIGSMLNMLTVIWQEVV